MKKKLSVNDVKPATKQIITENNQNPFKITIIEARGIKMSKKGNDPFVEIRIRGEDRYCSTTVKQQTNDPFWDETFEIYPKDPQNDFVSLKLYNQKKKGKPPKMLSEIEFPVARYKGAIRDDWLEWREKKSNVWRNSSGEVHIKVEFGPLLKSNSLTAIPNYPQQPHALQARLSEGSNPNVSTVFTAPFSPVPSQAFYPYPPQFSSHPFYPTQTFAQPYFAPPPQNMSSGTVYAQPPVSFYPQQQINNPQPHYALPPGPQSPLPHSNSGKSCGLCGKMNGVDASFCSGCGGAIHPRQERPISPPQTEKLPNSPPPPRSHQYFALGEENKPNGNYGVVAPAPMSQPLPKPQPNSQPISQPGIEPLTRQVSQLNITTGFEISKSELKFEDKVGKGSFGVVWRGLWRGGRVAIKQMKSSAIKEEELNEFKSEMLVMANLRPHSHVVQFLAICLEPLCIVTEYMDQGSLYDFLHSNRLMDLNFLMNSVKGISSGMLHLHTEGIIHRDLAARNVLIGTGNQVKISDFGLARIAKTGNGSQTKNAQGPLKWMAPESLDHRIYSRETDMWAFGVTLWEIATRSDPWPELDPVQAALQVASPTKPLRLVSPSFASPIIKELMQGCFHTNPSKRPSFNAVCDRLQKATLTEWAPSQQQHSQMQRTYNSMPSAFDDLKSVS